jgi:perosamine synthetase
VLEFERALNQMLGRHVVAVSSGTAALHLALNALGIGPGDEVVLPSLTFCATAQAVTATGATPVFCEIEPETLNLDVTDVASRLSERTKAIIPVHSCGNVCKMDALDEMAKRHGLRLVEDAAHAFGSSYRGHPVGGFGDVTCFSFDPIKNITCGEGGAVVTNDAVLAALLRRQRLLGMHRDSWQRSSDHRPWWYEVDVQGYRYHMSNINAAIGLAQLARFPRFRERRRELVRRYNESFRGIAGLDLLRWQLEDCCPFSYIVRVRSGKRDELFQFLASRGIEAGVNYVPNHLQPYFARYACPLPATEKTYDEIINLPMYSEMTADDFLCVTTAVHEFFEWERTQ